MRLYFGLNIILNVEMIDNEVGYHEVFKFNVHNIQVGGANLPGHIRTRIFCDYHGERINFKSFDDVARLDKRKLLALRNITVILS